MTLSKQQIKEWDDIVAIHCQNLVNHIASLLSNPVNIINIGSNVGKLVALLDEKRLVKNAILIEPVPELYEYAKEKYPQWNHCNFVCGEEYKKVSFNIETGDNLGTSRVLSHTNDAPQLQMINTVDYLYNQWSNFFPELIVVDAEGYDEKIVLNLFPMIEEWRPIVVYETDPSRDITEIRNKFEPIGYKVEPFGNDVFLLPG